MARWLRTCAVAVAVGWPVALHAAAISGHPGWMPAITCGAAVCAAAIGAALTGTRAALLLGLALIVGLIGLAVAAPTALVFGPPIAIDAALGAWFGRSLRAGREPVVAVFARMEQGTLTPELVRYTRAVTWLWTLLLVALAVAAALVAAYASLSTWSWFANCATYVAVAGLFVGEYLYRRVRFPNYRHASLVTLVRNVRAQMAWRHR